MRGIWFVCGLVSVILGVIGIPLPLLPTVPFFLLAAFCFARSSEMAHSWLINHKSFGPPIKDWKRTGAIKTPVKIYATIFIAFGFSISVFLALKPWLLLLQFTILSGVTVFLWTRPHK